MRFAVAAICSGCDLELMRFAVAITLAQCSYSAQHISHVQQTLHAVQILHTVPLLRADDTP